MNERQFEDILSRYPELIEEGLAFKGRQVHVKGKYVDLHFEDRHGQTLIVELKIGTIKREHTAQLLDYEGHFLSPDDHPVRVMLIGNRVPPNFRRSLDYHGFEWREITVSSLIKFLKEKDDKEYLAYFPEEHLRPKQRIADDKRKIRPRTAFPSGSSLRAESLGELEKNLIFRYEVSRIHTAYMDLLLLRNKDERLRLSQIWEEWMKYAEKVNSRDFGNVSLIRKHIKYREDNQGWVFESDGGADAVVYLAGFVEDSQTRREPSSSKEGKGRIFTPNQFYESSYFRLCSPTSQSLLRYLVGRADSLGMQYVMKIRGDGAVTMAHTDEHGRNFVTLRPQQNSLSIEIFGVTGRVPYDSSEEIESAMVPQRIKEKYDEICEQLGLESTSMKPSRESFWKLLLDKTVEVCAKEGLTLDLKVGSEGRFAKAPTGIAGVMWAYAISHSTAWVELEIRGNYRDEVYGRLSGMRDSANRQFESEIGERIYWDKEAHDSGRDREVYRITSDSKHLFFDTGEGWNELIDDLTRRMIGFVKIFDNELQSIKGESWR